VAMAPPPADSHAADAAPLGSGARADAGAVTRGQRPVRKRLVLVACILGSGVALVDGTVVNVALPTIQRSLGGGLAAQQWMVNAYLLTLGSLILIGGSLGDLFGERRVFAIGVGAFGVTSALCALAPTVGVLIAARALQGVAGALLTPSALAVIIATFHEQERGRAIGSWTAWSGIATVIGPLGGGALLNVASWRWIFLINIPLVALCLALILISVPRRPPGGSRPPIDWLGAALAAFGLGGPVFAFIEQPRLGWSSPAVVGPLIAGVALLVAFVVRERRARAPMLPLELFARRNFTVGNVETLAMYSGLAILLFFLVLFLQQVAGYTPLQSGLATLPITAVMLLFSRRFGALADRHGPRLFMGAGPVVAAAGMLLLLRVDARADYAGQILPALLVFSVGLAMTVAPLTAAVLADVPEDHAGIGSAINNAIARVAGLLGTSALGAVVAAQFAAGIHQRLPASSLDAPGRQAVTTATRLSLGRPAVSNLPSGERRRIDAAAVSASVHTFRVGMGVAASLVGLAGLMAAAGIRNPRRRVRAELCEGGALVGASPDAAGCPEPAQPAVAVGRA